MKMKIVQQRSEANPPSPDNTGINDKYSFKGSRNKKGERHGYGEAILENGDQYNGEYKNGLRHGYGEYFFFDASSPSSMEKGGAKYVGNYSNNKKNGYGVFYYSDGSR